MLKRDITYEDFDGNKVKETFYFNLTEAEMVELEFSSQEGFGETMQRVIKAEDKPTLIAAFKKIILMAYGERDGKRFVKNDAIREAFSQTAAYSALFMELATDDNAAAIFVKGVLPKNMSVEFEKAIKNPESNQTPLSVLPPPVS